MNLLSSIKLRQARDVLAIQKNELGLVPLRMRLAARGVG
jgi:hypothetical protein